jgi:hypothetical protein
MKIYVSWNGNIFSSFYGNSENNIFQHVEGIENLALKGESGPFASHFISCYRVFCYVLPSV